MPIAYSGDSIAFADGSTLASGRMGMVNRIINGDMRIAQRGTSFAFVNGNTSVYTLDRWRCDDMNGSSFTISQSTDAPAGFNNSLLVTTSSGNGSITSGQYAIVQQQFEANNVNDLAWGTANAKAVTLSFWVKSSLIGTFGGTIRDNAATYSFPFTYTIAAANTWTQVFVPISGPTTGSFSGTNGLGFTVFFSLGVGSALSAAAGSWVAGNYLNATGAGTTGVCTTTGATFQLTGVDLRAGTYASAPTWEFRDVQRELAMCQRYYETHSTEVYNTSGVNTDKYWYWQFKVTKRAAPTVTYTGYLITSCVGDVNMGKYYGANQTYMRVDSGQANAEL